MTAEECINKAYHSILHSDFEQAIYWFEQAIALEGDNPNHHYKLSITYARSNRVALAIEQAELAIHYAPSNEGYKIHLNCLLAKKKTMDAKKMMYQSLQETHHAIMLLKEAIALDSLAIQSYVVLAMAYAELQDYHQAIQYVKEAQKLDPYDIVIEDLLNQYKQSLAKLLKS
ncbi:hypothetical protein BVG16_03940 [Paenibacillus selenitireducens]|uniref:Uncharacterized protein n=1 Tax=Paenibacillus selenitireducens TaxID=1324314 RepID=A0A1T2XNR4_9BACL|nr:tetratricopeptide repeat protein [Paenibacillus selenitireducens]OPA81468.1 hypothetical protein BVG16_03940 [Paenibacillus selenitireducens]